METCLAPRSPSTKWLSSESPFTSKASLQRFLFRVPAVLEQLGRREPAMTSSNASSPPPAQGMQVRNGRSRALLMIAAGTTELMCKSRQFAQLDPASSAQCFLYRECRLCTALD